MSEGDVSNAQILSQVDQMAAAAEKSAGAMEAVLAMLREDRERFDAQREAARGERRGIENRVAALEGVVRGTGEEGRRGLTERIGVLEAQTGRVSTSVAVAALAVLVTILLAVLRP